MPHHGRQPLTPEQVLDYLRTHVYTDGECLLWAGPFTKQGYPRIMWARTRYMARRLLLELTGRRIRNGEVVWATCGSPVCMTEAHLKISRRGDMVRAHAKQGRMLSGARRSLVVAMSRAPKAKLPITEARTVLELRAQGVTMGKIGERYGVTGGAVSHAIAAWRRAGVTEWTVREAA